MPIHKENLGPDSELDTLLARGASQEIYSPEHYRTLESRVLQQSLPPQPLSPVDAFILWLSPQDRFSWRAPLAASFALFLGIAVANVYDFGLGAADAYDAERLSWEDELSLMSLADLNTSTSPENATSRNQIDG